MKIKIKNDRNEVIALLQAKDSELTIFQVPSKKNIMDKRCIYRPRWGIVLYS